MKLVSKEYIELFVFHLFRLLLPTLPRESAEWIQSSKSCKAQPRHLQTEGKRVERILKLLFFITKLYIVLNKKILTVE
jgi:hypothetical protein